ncbi:hypothetical protein GQR58_021216 [Nymphon striatum]|nr:hypothetical protein GQR58_021216 [Nymphon striatum]
MRLLLEKYGIEDPSTGERNTYTNPELQALYDQLLNIALGSDDLAALRVGALVEESDIEDIQTEISQVSAEHQDIISTYENLLCGSRNHLRAFAGRIESITGEDYQTQLPVMADEVDEILNSSQEQYQIQSKVSLLTSAKLSHRRNAMKKILKNFIFLPLIIAAAVAFVVMQVKSKEPIEHKEVQFPVKTVEVLTVKKVPFRTRAIAYGNVEPSTILKAKSEVNGKISYIHPDLKQGGSLPKGTTVLRIETTTFEISLDSSKAGLASSQSSLKQIEAEEKSTKRSLQIAQKNLKLGLAELQRVKVLVNKRTLARNQLDVEEQKVLQLRSTVETLQGSLDTYASRKASTRAQIKQSKSQVDQSKDTLIRTEVASVSVEAGEFVSAGAQLFEALGIEAVEINAQLPIKHVRPLASTMSQAPNLGDMQSLGNLQNAVAAWNLEAKVRIVGAGQNAEWQGKLLRIGESVDPNRDTLGMVVAVEKPYEGVIPGVRPPLIKGMYASVEFLSSPRDLLVIPRKAIHENRVYVVSAENTLSIRPVQISYSQGQLVVIKEGLKEGDKIITSDLVPVIEGLKLELIESDIFQKEIEALALGKES